MLPNGQQVIQVDDKGYKYLKGFMKQIRWNTKIKDVSKKESTSNG